MDAEVEGNRRRSSSDPLRSNRPIIGGAGQRNTRPMPEVREDGLDTSAAPQNLDVPVNNGNAMAKRPSIASFAGSLLRFPTYNNSIPAVDVQDPEQYNERFVDLLDTLGMWNI